MAPTAHWTLLDKLEVLAVSPTDVLANQDQYHIQTDEGPERYFRYLTSNGQYRKEKRMEDGTVIGTYGWVDADGMLRLTDYIADNEGYRIVNSKDVYVGKDTSMRAALKMAKRVPSKNNILNDSKYRAVTQNTIDYKVLPTATSYQPSSYYSQPSEQRSVTYYSPNPYSSSSTSSNALPHISRTPYVQILPNSIPSSTESPLEIISQIPSSTAEPADHVPTTTLAPPVAYGTTTVPTVYITGSSVSKSSVASSRHSSTVTPFSSTTSSETFNQDNETTIHNATPIPIIISTQSYSYPSSTTSARLYPASTPSGYSSSPFENIYTSTPSGKIYSSGNPSFTTSKYLYPPQVPSAVPFVSPHLSSVVPSFSYSSSTTSQELYPSSTSTNDIYETASTINSPVVSNNLDRSHYSGAPQYEHYNDEYRGPIENPYAFQNGPTYPIDQNGRIYTGRFNYDEQRQPRLSGMAVTNDGFRYYLPKQYHEEHNPPGEDNKVGSFGYIDPFGIRRVIYYNADPVKGFLHKKNNRYVGLDAAPYDPKPV